MKLWASFLALVFVAAWPTIGRAADARFSQTLSLTEFAEAGFKKLSSDQVAVIDALVRRDLAGETFRRRDDPPPAARFSQRLTDDERRTAGLDLLSEAELARFDALVERHAAASSAHALLGPLVVAPSTPRVRPVEGKTAPEVHGSFMFSMGWGKGGYSEKTGGMTLNYEDPTHGLAISVSYSETRVKGPGPYIYRDPIAPPSPIAPER